MEDAKTSLCWPRAHTECDSGVWTRWLCHGRLVPVPGHAVPWLGAAPWAKAQGTCLLNSGTEHLLLLKWGRAHK